MKFLADLGICITLLISMIFSNISSGFVEEDLKNVELETHSYCIASKPHSYNITGTHKQIESYNIIISYPQIYEIGDIDLQDNINKTISTEALKILNFYENENLEEFKLNIYYEIVLANETLMSIQYFGFASGEDYPHCHKLFYTTNIDLKNGKKLRLKDIVEVNTEFASLFLNEDFEYDGPLASDESSCIHDTYTDLNMLLQDFTEADTMEQMLIYSYMTHDSLGISMETQHAIGGYAKFKIPYKNIENYLKKGVVVLDK